MKDFFKLKIAGLLSKNPELEISPVTYHGQGWKKMGMGCDIKGKGYNLTIEPIQRSNGWDWLVVNHTDNFWVDHFNTYQLNRYLKMHLL